MGLKNFWWNFLTLAVWLYQDIFPTAFFGAEWLVGFTQPSMVIVIGCCWSSFLNYRRDVCALESVANEVQVCGLDDAVSVSIEWSLVISKTKICGTTKRSFPWALSVIVTFSHCFICWSNGTASDFNRVRVYLKLFLKLLLSLTLLKITKQQARIILLYMQILFLRRFRVRFALVFTLMSDVEKT